MSPVKLCTTPCIKERWKVKNKAQLTCMKNNSPLVSETYRYNLIIITVTSVLRLVSRTEYVFLRINNCI